MEDACWAILISFISLYLLIKCLEYQTKRHKKRTTAVVQPLLTLNLIL